MNLKKCIIVTGLGVSIFATTLHSGQAWAAQQTLKMGMRNADVQILQERLKELDYFKLTPTAYFGSATLAAVKEFQKANQLTPDGIVGSQTFSALERLQKTERPAVSSERKENNHYIVQKGDSLWSISQKFNTTPENLIKLNNLKSDQLQIGQKLVVSGQIQVSRGEEQTTRVSSKYGEALPWYGQVEHIFPRDGVATVTDLQTGTSFRIMRTGGTNHADCEPLSLKDTEIMKSLYGGTWSWNRRAIIVETGGKRIAASMAGMPHAGRDDQPWLATVKNRSCNYGTGTNLDKIKGNGMNGHFDVHFAGSKTHASNKVDSQHQSMVRKAAGK